MDSPPGRLKNKDFTTQQRIKFYNSEGQAQGNSSSIAYPGYSENLPKSDVFVSPILVASMVIGLVVAISSVTIILGSTHKEWQRRLQQYRPCCRRRRRRGQDEDDEESEEDTAWSQEARFPCGLAGDWEAPVDLSSRQALEAIMLHEVAIDSPPGYEECMGPGATQLYLPTEAPPPYSLTDGSGSKPAQSGPRTVSMDVPPSYEAVCEAQPPSSQLPLPGPEPGPSCCRGPPAPDQAAVSNPEMAV